MKTKILTGLLFLSAPLYSQTDRSDKESAKQVASSHFKSTTQTAYKYVYNPAAGGLRQSSNGTKVTTCFYDAKGNTTESITYNDYGNVDSKKTSKYDTRGNATETVTYGDDGIVQSKVIYRYNVDTITDVKIYKPDGTLDHENFFRMLHGTLSSSEIYSTPTSLTDTNHQSTVRYKVNDLISYGVSDSIPIACVRYVYDGRGNLIMTASWKYHKSGKGFITYNAEKETFTYNSKNDRMEDDIYNDDDELTEYRNFKYDEKGNLVEIEQRDTILVYKNDSKGNTIEAIMYDANKTPITAYKYSHTYYQ